MCNIATRSCRLLEFHFRIVGLVFCTVHLEEDRCEAHAPPLTHTLAHTLLKTACHFLMLLVVFDTLTYRKDYDRSPTLLFSLIRYGLRAVLNLPKCAHSVFRNTQINVGTSSD